MLSITNRMICCWSFRETPRNPEPLTEPAKFSSLPDNCLEAVFAHASPIDIARCTTVGKDLRFIIFRNALIANDASWQEGNKKVIKFLKENEFQHIHDIKEQRVMGFKLSTWPLKTALLELNGQDRLDMLTLLIERGGMFVSDIPGKNNTNEAKERSKIIIKGFIYCLVKPTFELNINEKKELINFLIDKCGIEDLGKPPNGGYNIIQVLANSPDDSIDFKMMLDFIIEKIGKDQYRKLYEDNRLGIKAENLAGSYNNIFLERL